MPTYCSPSALRCRAWTCDYCSSVASVEIWTNTYKFGILTCPSHEAWGQRDSRAYYQRQNWVKVEDFLMRFPVCAGLEVPKSGGTGLSAVMKYRQKWVIPLLTPQCVVPFAIADLGQKPGIMQEDVAAMLGALESGFYAGDVAAYELAKGSVLG